MNNIQLNSQINQNLTLNLPIHHIGIACKNIETELEIFKNLGFILKDSFIDSNQGIRGSFIIPKDNSHTHYCFELLENINDNGILDSYLKNNTKMYHIAFISQNIESDIQRLFTLFTNTNEGGGNHQPKNTMKKTNMSKPKVISKILSNEYFLKLCFVMLPNRLLIEFVELR